jgi:hypothetical protein
MSRATVLLRRRPPVTTDRRRIRDYARALVRGDADPPLIVFADADGKTWAAPWADYARELVRARQLGGIAKAKLNGIYKGRSPTIDTVLVPACAPKGSALPRLLSSCASAAAASTAC